MESGFWGRVKAVIAAYSAGTTLPYSEEHGRTHSNSPSSGKFDTPYKSIDLLTSPSSIIAGKEMTGMDSGTAEK